METYINTLIQNLYQHYNYSILEFGEINGVYVNWGVYKKSENSTDVLFFSSLDSSYKLNVYEIETLARNQLKTNNVKLIHIIIDDKSKIQNGDTEGLYPNYKIYPQCETILINSVDNKVLYSSNALKDKAEELARIINHINTSQNVSMKSEKSIITYVLISLNVLLYISIMLRVIVIQ